MSLPARIALSVFALAVATIIWSAARAVGLLGAAAFYFPAILMVTLFAGWEFGATALFGSIVLFFFVAPMPMAGGPLVSYSLAGILQVLLAGFVRELLRESWQMERTLRALAERREREADTRELALGEARHRLKNLMTIIEALAKFSGARPGAEPTVEVYLSRFLGRLRALGTASDLVLKHRPDMLEANAVIGAVLQPYLSGVPSRLRVEGPQLELSENFSGALALAVHELATNALKYGALSVPSGRASLRWTATPNQNGDHIVFLWTEEGGPTPTRPARDGFGHRLIRSVASRECEGEVVIDYPPEGLTCRIAYVRRRPAHES